MNGLFLVVLLFFEKTSWQLRFKLQQLLSNLLLFAS